MNRHIVHILRWFNPTFRAEIEILYTEWCEKHCFGKFDVVSPTEVRFELISDADNFEKAYVRPWMNEPV